MTTSTQCALSEESCSASKRDMLRSKNTLYMIVCMYSICRQHAVSFFVNSSAQHRKNEAEPDSIENKISKARFKLGPKVPCHVCIYVKCWKS